ncbi:hypothetical protein PVAND_006677 [Polypedilum vanderplanki]|uniref:Uncharacterized protein n=1 Tax=Polypedilum vanderplanki TaxID=319348 RepID=A0A9J6C5L0_POLVA|nr:hypothetical protein PVAND_006677 [Polypedilum vanderplanki]
MGRPRAFGTINFCKLNIEPRITDRIKIEKGNSNNRRNKKHFGSKGLYRRDENILILGDFNHELKLGSPLELFMLQSFGTRLFSPRELTTNARTVIDGVFGRIEDYNVEVFIYESYASHHKPLVIRVHEL